MRRIIERTVTVVTTTTWTISWQADADHTDPQADPVDQAVHPLKSLPDSTEQIRQFSTVSDTKEAEPAQTKSEIDPSADMPPSLI